MLFTNRLAIDLATGLAMVLLLLTAIQPTYASQQKANTFNCTDATTGTAHYKKSAAEILLNNTSDTSRLACGARVIIRIADDNPGDYEAQLSALRANARYIYYLDRIVLYELGYLISWYVTEVPEETKQNAPMIALIAAQKEQIRVLQQARDAGFDSPEMDYFTSLGIGPVAKALPLLKGVVAEDPQSLQGAAHALLAQTYYALPDMLGGDLDLAIAMMQAARERAPANPRFARLLAGYLLDIAKPDEAIAILKQFLTMKSGMAGWQLMADQLRLAADMAERIGDEGLADQLSKQRSKMFETHNFLQTRTVVSAMGHFGDKDPMAKPD